MKTRKESLLGRHHTQCHTFKNKKASACMETKQAYLLNKWAFHGSWLCATEKWLMRLWKLCSGNIGLDMQVKSKRRSWDHVYSACIHVLNSFWSIWVCRMVSPQQQMQQPVFGSVNSIYTYTPTFKLTKKRNYLGISRKDYGVKGSSKGPMMRIQWSPYHDDQQNIAFLR